MTHEIPAAYDVDTDEMTAGQLAALAEARGRLAAHFAHNPHLARTVTGIVDEYAAELAWEGQDQ
jgi:hypothetical protein